MRGLFCDKINSDEVENIISGNSMKRSQVKTMALAFVASLVLSSLIGPSGLVAFAQVQEEEEKTQEQVDAERFNEADSDGDGAINREEFRTYITSKLKNFDKVDEFMNRLDTSQDNKISPEEFQPRQLVIAKMVEEDNAERRKNEPKEFADVFNARFLPNNPKLGAIVPEELTAFDERGKKLSFKDLRGKYTVLNFGCLT